MNPTYRSTMMMMMLMMMRRAMTTRRPETIRPRTGRTKRVGRAMVVMMMKLLLLLTHA